MGVGSIPQLLPNPEALIWLPPFWSLSDLNPFHSSSRGSQPIMSLFTMHFVLFCFVLFKADHADHGRCGGESPLEANHCRSVLALSLEAGSFVHPLLSQCRVFTPAQAPFPSSLAPSRGRPRRSRGVVGRSPPASRNPITTPWSRGQSSSQPGEAEGEEAAPSRRAGELEPTGDGRRTAQLDRWRRRLQLFLPFPILEMERGPKPEWQSRDLPWAALGEAAWDPYSI